MADSLDLDLTVLTAGNGTPRELEELAALVNSAYRGESSRAGWTTEADLLSGQRTDAEVLRAELAQPNRKILVVRARGEKAIVGCVSLERFEDQQGVGVYLGMLTVKPTRQAHGLGKKILSMAEDQAREWGASRMTMGVIPLRQELVAWYERRGYRRNGDIKPFPYDDEKFGSTMRADLYFVMLEKNLIS